MARLSVTCVIALVDALRAVYSLAGEIADVKRIVHVPNAKKHIEQRTVRKKAAV